MFIQFLGTGLVSPPSPAMYPVWSSNCWTSSMKSWLFDCGEGTQNRFWKRLFDPARFQRFSSLICMGTIFLVCQVFWLAALSSPTMSNHYYHLWPGWHQDLVLTSLKVSGSRLPYRIHFPGVWWKSLGLIFAKMTSSLSMQTSWTIRPSVLASGDAKRLEGTLDVEKSERSLCSLSPLWKNQEWGNVVLEDGTGNAYKALTTSPCYSGPGSKISWRCIRLRCALLT